MCVFVANYSLLSQPDAIGGVSNNTILDSDVHAHPIHINSFQSSASLISPYYT